MDRKGQLTGMPIQLVIAIVIGVMVMGILMQFVGTAERMVLRDMGVVSTSSGSNLTVRVFDAQSGQPLNGATMVVKYPGGIKAHTCSESSNQWAFEIPTGGSDVVVSLRVTHRGYIPWEGEVAVPG